MTGLDDHLLVVAGVQRYDRLDDPSGRRAAEGVRYTARRDDVCVDAELVRVIPLVPERNIDFLHLGRVDSGRRGDLLNFRVMPGAGLHDRRFRPWVRLCGHSLRCQRIS